MVGDGSEAGWVSGEDCAKEWGRIGVFKAASLPEYKPEPQPLAPPRLPGGYQARCTPIPLLSSKDTYWVAWATDGEFDMGLLIYQEDTEALFVICEEAATMLAMLLEHVAADILPMCSEEYCEQHAPGMALIGAYVEGYGRGNRGM